MPASLSFPAQRFEPARQLRRRRSARRSARPARHRCARRRRRARSPASAPPGSRDHWRGSPRSPPLRGGMIIDQADPPRLVAIDRLGGEQQPRRLARPDQGDEPVHVLLRIGDADLGRGDREFARRAARSGSRRPWRARRRRRSRRPRSTATVGMASARSASSAARMSWRKRAAAASSPRIAAKSPRSAPAQKVSPAAGHDQQPDVARRDHVERLGQLGPARRRNGVAGLGPVEGQPGDSRHCVRGGTWRRTCRARPAFVAQKKAGLPDTRRPGQIVPRRPVRWRRGAAGECRREHSRASTRRPDREQEPCQNGFLRLTMVNGR